MTVEGYTQLSSGYLAALLKESQRLQTATGIAVRTAQSDLVIHGYRIPRGTSVTATLQVIGLTQFSQPELFSPER